MASTSGSTVGKGSTTLELIYGSISGMAFGLVSPLASQPFDTLKTKMQAEAKYANEGMVNTARAIARTDGLKGFYRGMVPILLSTGVQKSALFAGYAGAKRWCDQSQIGLLTTPLPGFGGMSLSVVVGAPRSGVLGTLAQLRQHPSLVAHLVGADTVSGEANHFHMKYDRESLAQYAQRFHPSAKALAGAPPAVPVQPLSAAVSTAPAPPIVFSLGAPHANAMRNAFCALAWPAA